MSKVTDVTTIAAGLNSCLEFEDRLLVLCLSVLKAANGKLFGVDLLMMAAATRSLSQNRGFKSLIADRNYLCAAPLVRLQLDIALRFSAAWLVSNPHELAMKVWDGVEVRKLRDRDGELMTDAYLVRRMSKSHPWVARVYKNTSGFIHLSNKHFNSFWGEVSHVDSASAKAEVMLSSHIAVPEKLYVELINAFLASNDIFISYVAGWLLSKGYEIPEVRTDK